MKLKKVVSFNNNNNNKVILQIQHHTIKGAVIMINGHTHTHARTLTRSLVCMVVVRIVALAKL